MEIKDMELSVRNTDAGLWLVSVGGFLQGVESISFTVAIPRSDKSLEQVARQAVQRAADLLLEYLQATASKP